jgi:hypothetical protein
MEKLSCRRHRFPRMDPHPAGRLALFRFALSYRDVEDTALSRTSMKPETRDALLTAIAKARSCIEDIVEGRIASLAEMAQEAKGKGR